MYLGTYNLHTWYILKTLCLGERGKGGYHALPSAHHPAFTQESRHIKESRTRVNKQGWRRWFPPNFLFSKKAEYRYRLVSKLECETQCRSEKDDHLDRGNAWQKAAMVTVAAAKIDQFICRLIDRAVADRCYGL